MNKITLYFILINLLHKLYANTNEVSNCKQVSEVNPYSCRLCRTGYHLEDNDNNFEYKCVINSKYCLEYKKPNCYRCEEGYLRIFSQSERFCRKIDTRTQIGIIVIWILMIFCILFAIILIPAIYICPKRVEKIMRRRHKVMPRIKMMDLFYQSTDKKKIDFWKNEFISKISLNQDSEDLSRKSLEKQSINSMK